MAIGRQPEKKTEFFLESKYPNLCAQWERPARAKEDTRDRRRYRPACVIIFAETADDDTVKPAPQSTLRVAVFHVHEVWSTRCATAHQIQGKPNVNPSKKPSPVFRNHEIQRRRLFVTAYL